MPGTVNHAQRSPSGQAGQDDQRTAAGLPRLHTVSEVAEALRSTERYVREQARLRRWPHRRMARGVPVFTAQDVADILELQREPVLPDPVAYRGLTDRSAAYRRRYGPSSGRPQPKRGRADRA